MANLANDYGYGQISVYWVWHGYAILRSKRANCNGCDTSIPQYCIPDRLNTAFKGHTIIWYTEMKEIHGRGYWSWWKSQKIQKYSNGTFIWKETIQCEIDKYSVDKDPNEWFLKQSKGLNSIDPHMNTQMRNQNLLTQFPGELEHAVKCKCKKYCT
ncbi:hypothetical protein O181_018303 [Austropuccinia psidii MF-1]|uniref:Uncharacterized protein n=1 Tax=Austropuccinia psidii MF-1 TaxID=1389203 RepID=A0A9Q3C8V2_9BASI|nr:hypothetical protein [Austropuccinia psidii MF-1]